MTRRRVTFAAALALALAALVWRAWGEGEDTSTEERTCELCGCTDDRGCPGGCSWSRIWERDGVDVCSRCADLIKAAFELEQARDG